MTNPLQCTSCGIDSRTDPTIDPDSLLCETCAREEAYEAIAEQEQRREAGAVSERRPWMAYDKQSREFVLFGSRIAALEYAVNHGMRGGARWSTAALLRPARRTKGDRR